MSIIDQINDHMRCFGGYAGSTASASSITAEDVFAACNRVMAIQPVNPVRSLIGKKIISSPSLVKKIQVKFPRSKRKRIRKKFAKNEANYKTVVDESVYVTRDCIICHPSVACHLKSPHTHHQPGHKG